MKIERILNPIGELLGNVVKSTINGIGKTADDLKDTGVEIIEHSRNGSVELAARAISEGVSLVKGSASFVGDTITKGKDEFSKDNNEFTQTMSEAGTWIKDKTKGIRDKASKKLDEIKKAAPGKIKQAQDAVNQFSTKAQKKAAEAAKSVYKKGGTKEDATKAAQKVLETDSRNNPAPPVEAQVVS